MAVVALAAVAVLGACGGSAPPTTFVHGPASLVQAATVGGLGRVLVDGSGGTLYLFTPDRASGRSTCASICAAEWPPLVLPAGTTAPEAGPGVDRSLLGTTRRPDGGLQVTYAGWPLYTWVGDTGPGSATGQGLANAGGQWWVVRPSGTPET